MDAFIETLKQPAVQAAVIVIALAALVCTLLAARWLNVHKPNGWAETPKHIPLMLYAGGTTFGLAMVAYILAHQSSDRDGGPPGPDLT